MVNVQFMLTEQQTAALHTIAQQTGKTEDEVVREAVEQFLDQFQQVRRQQLLRQARGMWRDHTDLPSLRVLRDEFDRVFASGELLHE
jgi:hypothetical protein